VRLVFILLAAAARLDRWVDCRPLREDRGELFRLDAKAEGDNVVVGGWETGRNPDPSTARWFEVTLTRANSSWAFSKGEAFRTIAALELYAFLIGVMVFVKPTERNDFDASLGMTASKFTAFTDNQSNQFLIDKLLTTKMPLGAVLMEVAWQLALRNVTAALRWIPRLQNTEADALTNADYSSFSLSNRIPVSVETLNFGVLPQLLAAEEEFAQCLAAAKARKAAVGPITKRGREETLRLRDPW
jgi:hypothetical protein